ncbi:MAG: hypothetical protein ACXVYY_18555 [Oryzihumus sp.]
MTVSLESLFSDADLLRALVRARVAVEDAGTGGGRLHWLTALEDEMDRRLAARRVRSSAAFGALFLAS